MLRSPAATRPARIMRTIARPREADAYSTGNGTAALPADNSTTSLASDLCFLGFILTAAVTALWVLRHRYRDPQHFFLLMDRLFVVLTRVNLLVSIPTLKDAQADLMSLSLPNTFEDVKRMRGVMLEYKEQHPLWVFLAFSFVYVFKQTFSIPGMEKATLHLLRGRSTGSSRTFYSSGSALMNLIAGVLFGLRIGFPLVCFLTGTVMSKTNTS